MNKVQIKVKRLHDDAVFPKYAHEFDSGFDLVAVEDVIIEPGQTEKVPTGLTFAIPAGYELQIRPRSGISSKTKLRISNSPGTVDAGYRGEVCVLIDNISIEPDPEIVEPSKYVLTVDGTFIYGDGKERPVGSYLIRKGDRIAQGVLAEVPHAVFEEVEELDETERGTGGFGSTDDDERGKGWKK
jgi:dUTP pyrophosphatase